MMIENLTTFGFNATIIITLIAGFCYWLGSEVNKYTFGRRSINDHIISGIKILILIIILPLILGYILNSLLNSINLSLHLSISQLIIIICGSVSLIYLSYLSSKKIEVTKVVMQQIENNIVEVKTEHKKILLNGLKTEIDPNYKLNLFLLNIIWIIILFNTIIITLLLNISDQITLIITILYLFISCILFSDILGGKYYIPEKIIININNENKKGYFLTQNNNLIDLWCDEGVICIPIDKINYIAIDDPKLKQMKITKDNT